MSLRIPNITSTYDRFHVLIISLNTNKLKPNMHGVYCYTYRDASLDDFKCVKIKT